MIALAPQAARARALGLHTTKDAATAAFITTHTDVTNPASVSGVLAQAAAAHGAVELVLNAAAAYGGERTGPFGDGPIAEADLSGFDSWPTAPARAAFSFLPASGRFAIAQGRPATLVQVTGGSARRAMPERGLWAAGSFAVRAITNAAAPAGDQAVGKPCHSCTRGALPRRRLCGLTLASFAGLSRTTYTINAPIAARPQSPINTARTITPTMPTPFRLRWAQRQNLGASSSRAQRAQHDHLPFATRRRMRLNQAHPA